MKLLPHVLAVSLLCVLGATAQTGSDAHHFEKDGLSFDYPAAWKIADLSNSQMQIVQIIRGDGFAEIRIRVPRAPLQSPQREVEAKKVVQDKYVDGFIDSLQQAGLKPTRAEATTEIGGGPAVGIRIRAILEGAPGGMDSYYRVLSDRFVQLSQIASESEMKKSADAWDMLRNSIKVAGPAQPGASPAPAKP